MTSRITILSSVALISLSGLAVAEKPILSLSPVSAAIESQSRNGYRKELSADISANTTYTLDFVAGSGAVVVQFDLVLANNNPDASIDISNCGGSRLKDSNHAVYCNKLDDSRIRVLVDSPSNAEVPTAQLGTIKVDGGFIEIDRESVVVGNSEAKKINVDVL